MSQNHHQLISLFQQNKKSSGSGSGYIYKLVDMSIEELDVPFDTFSTFNDGILCYICSCLMKYYKDREIAIQNNNDFNSSLYSPVLLEKIDKGMIPIIVDINFEFSDNESFNFYHDKFIYECVSFLQELILGIFTVPQSDDGISKVLLAFVLETDGWNVNSKRFTNVRFHFPYAKVTLDNLNKYIITRFRSFLIENNIIKNYVYLTPLNIDRLVPNMTEYVCMYGSKQRKEEAPFILRGVYSYIQDCERLDEDYKDERYLPFFVNYNLSEGEIKEGYNYLLNPTYQRNDIVKLQTDLYFYPNNSSMIQNRLIELESINTYERSYNLPFILSVHFCQDVLKLDPNIQINSITVQEPETKKVTFFDQGSAVNSNIDRFQMLQQLMPLISKHRFTEKYKYDWYSIGKAIHGIYNGNPVGLTIFEYYTEDPVMKEQCEKAYDNFCAEILDIRTIRYYVSQDNPEAYHAFCEGLYGEKIVQALSGKELDFVRFASEILCLKFVYDRNNDEWYFFNGTRLVKDTKAFILIDHIISLKETPGNDEVIKALYKYKDKVSVQCRESNDRFTKGYFEKLEKAVTALITKLAGLDFIKKIIAALQVCMYDDHLYKKTDENPLVMACQDCVLECFDNTIINRPGKMQDYITKSTNIPFPTTFTIDHPKVKFMLKYYSQVHTDLELCHWFLKHLASLLKGGNDEKFFINWIGEANASKSQVLKFLQAALGDYCVIVPNHIITLNINSNTGKPEPALERAKGARAAVAAETDRSEKWHVGHVKKFTSGDDYDNRTLNKEGGQRSASFQLIAMSNIDLDAPNADEAYYARYIKIPFLSKWVDNAPLSEAEQYAQRRFPIDLTFSSQIKYYAQAQLWLMFYYYPIYVKEGLRTLPEIVKTVTMKHQRDIDVIYNFIHDKLQIFFIGDPKDKIMDQSRISTVYDLHRIYKSWYRTAYGNDIQPLDQFKFRDEMARRIGTPDDYGRWFGISPKVMNDSVTL